MIIGKQKRKSDQGILFFPPPRPGIIAETNSKKFMYNNKKKKVEEKRKKRKRKEERKDIHTYIHKHAHIYNIFFWKTTACTNTDNINHHIQIHTETFYMHVLIFFPLFSDKNTIYRDLIHLFYETKRKRTNSSNENNTVL